MNPLNIFVASLLVTAVIGCCLKEQARTHPESEQRIEAMREHLEQLEQASPQVTEPVDLKEKKQDRMKVDRNGTTP